MDSGVPRQDDGHGVLTLPWMGLFGGDRQGVFDERCGDDI